MMMMRLKDRLILWNIVAVTVLKLWSSKETSSSSSSKFAVALIHMNICIYIKLYV